MILHLVLFRFKPGTGSEAIAAAGGALLSLQGKIPDIRAIRWGPNLAADSLEYSHGLVVALKDMAAVERYRDHPAHREVVAKYLAPIRESRLAADLEA